MEVVLYVKEHSLRCRRTKGFLERKGLYVKVIHTPNEDLHELLLHKRPVPYVFIDQRPVGGFGEIKSLESSGTLDRLIRGEV
jgi:glutaredoxin